MSPENYAKRTRRSVLICEMPVDERPRERLLRHGAAVLSNAELLSILLRTGRPGASAIDLARELLRQAGGLVGLGNELARLLGVSARSVQRMLTHLKKRGLVEQHVTLRRQVRPTVLWRDARVSLRR